MTLKAAVYFYLDEQPEQIFSLWGLTDLIGLTVGRRVMPHTVRAACKDYADASGAEFYCVDNAHSRYKYIPGFKIAGALTGRE